MYILNQVFRYNNHKYEKFIVEDSYKSDIYISHINIDTKIDKVVDDI